MKNKMLDFIYSVFREVKKLLGHIWPDLIGGLLLGWAAYTIAHGLKIEGLNGLGIEVVGVVLGIIYARVIILLVEYHRSKQIIVSIKDCVDKAHSDSREVYLLKKKILQEEINAGMSNYNHLFAGGRDCNLSEYERLIEYSIDLILKLKGGIVSIDSTCFVLPDVFQPNSQYAEMFMSLSRSLSEIGKVPLRRILCDHRKENLCKAIERKRKKFESFCDWNLNTGFELSIYKGSFDEKRREHNLALNDFAIIGDLVVVGGDIREAEKMKREKKSHETVISQTAINFEVHQYKTILNKIYNTSNYLTVDLGSKERYQQVLSFLKAN